MSSSKVSFTDISDWQKNIHYSTGGTRSKYIALHPETNEEYFFKGSKETPTGEIRYPNEFWSEIISSKVGQVLGFPMLDYNIAYNINHKQKIGCISKSMVLNSENKLTEGKTYLTGFNSAYDPDNDKKDYTLEFICDALKFFSFEKYIKNILEIIVFDSIIGNSDRHQENWGILTTHKIVVEEREKNNLTNIEKRSIYRQIRRQVRRFFSSENRELEEILSNPNLVVKFKRIHRFAPIYDSGCCLGREFSNDKIESILKDSQMIEAYIRKGESEIHWKGLDKKRKHFELLELILKDFPKETKEYISRVKENYNSELIKKLIEEVDIYLPDNLINLKLSSSRKKLMFKLITLRIEKLITYL